LWRLRCHPDAEIHFQQIAHMAREAMNASTPRRLYSGEWHLPLVSKVDEDELRTAIAYDWTGPRHDAAQYATERLCQVSVARCARVSYLTHEGKRDWRKDIELF